MFPGMGGRGGMNPKQLNAMMKQMGIKVDEIPDVEEVVIRTKDREIVLSEASVSKMVAQGQTTWQIMGRASERPRASEAPEPAGPLYTDADVKLVMENAGVSEAEARVALDSAKGETAEAILKLMEDR